MDTTSDSHAAESLLIRIELNTVYLLCPSSVYIKSIFRLRRTGTTLQTLSHLIGQRINAQSKVYLWHCVKVNKPMRAAACASEM